MQNNTTFPQLFLERFKLLAGESFDALLDTFVDRPTTFRVNTIKNTEHRARNSSQTVIEELQSLGFEVEQVSWYSDAYILRSRSQRELMATDIYKNGEIYLQSLASMVPPLVMDVAPGMRVLDMTAAPGSKTSQIAALMNKTGELIATELSKVRFFKLQHNMQLLGVSEKKEGWKLNLRYADAKLLTKEYKDAFDVVLLDAPCSAEARFDMADSKSWGYWKEDKIREMAGVQWLLLLSAWEMVRPGGTLIYSTCTFAPEENEYQISQFLNKMVERAVIEHVEISGLERMPLMKEWKGKVVRDDVVEHALRVLPTKDIEGFFIAKIKKQS